MERLLQFFRYDHLPEHLQAVSKPFHGLACHVVASIPNGPERTVCLRKLLEAKDCAVRAVLESSGANAASRDLERLDQDSVAAR